MFEYYIQFLLHPFHQMQLNPTQFTFNLLKKIGSMKKYAACKRIAFMPVMACDIHSTRGIFDFGCVKDRLIYYSFVYPGAWIICVFTQQTCNYLSYNFWHFFIFLEDPLTFKQNLPPPSASGAIELGQGPKKPRRPVPNFLISKGILCSFENLQLANKAVWSMPNGYFVCGGNLPRATSARRRLHCVLFSFFPPPSEPKNTSV